MKAELLLQLLKGDSLDESVLQIIGDLDALDIVTEFERLLDSMGFPEVLVEVALDTEDGIFVRFEDEERDDVVVLFAFDEDGDPLVTVVSEDDEQITIDLSPMEPPVIELDGVDVSFIDLLDLSWVNKSTLNILLQAGRVGPDSTSVKAPGSAAAEPAQESMPKLVDKVLAEAAAYAALGGKKMRLPIVKIKDEMDDKDKKIVMKAKSMGLL